MGANNGFLEGWPGGVGIIGSGIGTGASGNLFGLLSSLSLGDLRGLFLSTITLRHFVDLLVNILET